MLLALLFLCCLFDFLEVCLLRCLICLFLFVLIFLLRWISNLETWTNRWTWPQLSFFRFPNWCPERSTAKKKLWADSSHQNDPKWSRVILLVHYLFLYILWSYELSENVMLTPLVASPVGFTKTSQKHPIFGFASVGEICSESWGSVRNPVQDAESLLKNPWWQAIQYESKPIFGCVLYCSILFILACRHCPLIAANVQMSKLLFMCPLFNVIWNIFHVRTLYIDYILCCCFFMFFFFFFFYVIYSTYICFSRKWYYQVNILSTQDSIHPKQCV